jgi:hypothetical protein
MAILAEGDRENNDTDFTYPQMITYTISESDIIPPDP